MEDKLKKVAGSLEYGPLMQRWELIMQVGGIFCSAFFVALLLWMAFTEEEMEAAPVLFAIVALLMVGCASVFLVNLIKNHRHLKAIGRWMQDAVPYTVFAEKVDEDRIGYRWKYLPAVRIAVRFRYQGRRITRFSGEGRNGLNTRNGYAPGWKKYCDREINILYSPKYDQVIVLKDPDR